MLGDAITTIQRAPDFDYLFIDSDHSAQFAGWYIRALLPRVGPGIVVRVHDVFHQAELSEEEEVVAEWLIERGLPYWAVAAAVHTGERLEFLEERQKISADFETAIHA